MGAQSEIISEKVAREEEWAHDRRVERLSWRQIRDLAPLPREQGGLGYPLAVTTLQTRAAAYFEQVRGTMRTGVEERRARQEGEIDELIRMAVADIRAARAAGDVRASAAAEARLLKYQEREAQLFGIDAPARAQVEVTNHDAVAAELDAMMARLGMDPLPDYPAR